LNDPFPFNESFASLSILHAPEAKCKSRPGARQGKRTGVNRKLGSELPLYIIFWAETAAEKLAAE
jgi:hypothetical protein